MSPRTIKQNLELQDISRERIIDTALELFAAQGYESSTTRQIAERAGISQGLMYHYFKGKADLLRMVFARCAAPMQAIMAGAGAIEGPQARVDFVIRETFRVVREQPKEARLFYQLRSQGAFIDLLREETLNEVKALRSLLEGCFREMGRREPALDAALLYAQLEGMLRHALLEPETFPLEAAIERVIEVYTGLEDVR